MASIKRYEGFYEPGSLWTLGHSAAGGHSAATKDGDVHTKRHRSWYVRQLPQLLPDEGAQLFAPPGTLLHVEQRFFNNKFRLLGYYDPGKSTIEFELGFFTDTFTGLWGSLTDGISVYLDDVRYASGHVELFQERGKYEIEFFLTVFGDVYEGKFELLGEHEDE